MVVSFLLTFDVLPLSVDILNIVPHIQLYHLSCLATNNATSNLIHFSSSWMNMVSCELQIEYHLGYFMHQVHIIAPKIARYHFLISKRLTLFHHVYPSFSWNNTHLPIVFARFYLIKLAEVSMLHV